MRERYRADPELRLKACKQARDYARRNPLRGAATAYGVDVDRLELLLDRGCSICGAGWAPGIDVRLHADHDHRTGKFRGVLCQHCNHGIGQFYDDPALLDAAIDYLQAQA